MKIKGWELDFFNSGEWQVCDERLKDIEKVSRRIGRSGYNPGRSQLFRSLRSLPSDEVRCAIIGQDPYPNPEFATGLAFDVGPGLLPGQYPPTLKTFLGEYSTDLGLPVPSKGDLSGWNTPKGGVLLWNAIPSCRSGLSLSHDWPEWACLTKEIVTVLATKGIVFALLGQVARRSVSAISTSNNHIIVTSHPSPRGSMASRNPFIGSRLFSTINDKLSDQGLEVIDWKLP